MTNVLTKIELEEELFTKEFQKWSELVNRNTPLTEMIEKTKIQKYLKEAILVKERSVKKEQKRSLEITKHKIMLILL